MSLIDVIVIDSNDETGSSEEDVPLQKYQQEKRRAILNPIVYTTKLDDMKIFKNITSNVDGETIINSIIKESKPKFTRKRKYAPTANYSYEDLSCHIKSLNRKLARNAENKRHPICKPVRVVLEDIRYSLLRPQTTENRNSKPVNETRPLVSTKALSVNRKLRKTLIFDRQNQEADMYSLDKNFLVREHKKFRIHRNNDDIFRSLTLDKNVTEVSCCCWYVREKYLFSRVIPHETLRYMRKPHRCAINLCRCCCRNKNVSNETSAIRPQIQSESLSIWLNDITEKHASLPLTLLSKSLCVNPKYSEKKPLKSIQSVEPAPEEELPNILNSTGIDFKNEYYTIGADGHINVSIKDTRIDPQKLEKLKSKITKNIVGKICCWYRRETFANRLLLLGALPNTANHIRRTHSCSPTACSCCCKPSNTEKLEVAFIHKAARHTNDLVSKKVNVKVKFDVNVKKPVNFNPVKVEAELTEDKNNIISFNVSLSALQMIKGKGIKNSLSKDDFDLLIPESATHDKLKTVRVYIDKLYKNVDIESNTPLRDLTTKEAELLDIIFHAVNKAMQQSVPQIQKQKRYPSLTIPTTGKLVKDFINVGQNTVYPLLLNTQLSIATDLRNRRFLPSLRAHLHKYKLPTVSSSIKEAIKSNSPNTGNVNADEI